MILNKTPIPGFVIQSSKKTAQKSHAKFLAHLQNLSNDDSGDESDEDNLSEQEVDDDDTSGRDASDSELAEVQKIHGNQLISVECTK